MARLAGRNARIYMGLASSAATAEPIAFQSDWAISFVTDKFDVTAMGDSNHVYVAGLPDASGTFAGFYDDSTVQTYTAASDGQARKFYLYPNQAGNTGQYFFGTIIADFSASTNVGDSVHVNSSWNAASAITKVG